MKKLLILAIAIGILMLCLHVSLRQPRLEVELVDWWQMFNMEDYYVLLSMSSNRNVVCKKIIMEVKYRRSKFYWSYEHIYIYPNCIIEETSQREPVETKFIITPGSNDKIRSIKIESYVFYPVKIIKIEE